MIADALAADTDIEELLSEALLTAIAAGAGYVTSKPSLDRDSVDLFVHGGGDMSPAIGVQLKASVNLTIKDGQIKFPLPVKNYNDLRRKSLIPRMLVLMRLPKAKANWIKSSSRLLSIRHCAYWVCLEGATATPNGTKITVTVPAKNLITVNGLKDLMNRARSGSLL